MKKKCMLMMLLFFGFLLMCRCPDCHSFKCQCSDEASCGKIEATEPVYAAEKELAAEKKLADEKEMTVEEKIIAKCDTYEVDSTLALAISRLETGNFTSDAYVYGNNVGGISVDEVPMGFDTLDEGVEVFINNLKVNYYNEGLNDVDEIAQKYCPANEKQWAETVKALMKEISK